MFEELFGKAAFVVVHKIAPYAVERQQFLEHCREQGFTKTCLQRMAGILLAAAIDLQGHGGLDADEARLEEAATRIEAVRSEAGIRGHAPDRCDFLRVANQWLLFVGHLRSAATRPQPHAALVDDFMRWMTEERGLSPGTVKNRRWHLGQFLDWLHGHKLCVADLDLRNLDSYLQHLHSKGLSRVTIRIHTNAVRAFVRHAERRRWCAAGIAEALHGPRIYRDHGLPLGPSWDDVNRLIQDAASSHDAADVRDHAILLLLPVYGLRSGEVAGLRLEDVDWEHDRLTVRRSKPGRSHIYPMPLLHGRHSHETPRDSGAAPWPSCVASRLRRASSGAGPVAQGNR